MLNQKFGNLTHLNKYIKYIGYRFNLANLKDSVYRQFPFSI